ncbi:MAG: TerD family protein [Rhodocyclaceae bacterium]|nr:TerD family protein [Rhodocyclaceae bacterium]
MQSIYLRRRGKLLLTRGSGKAAAESIVALQEELERLGYVLAPEVCAVIETFDGLALARLHRSLLDDLRALVGANRGLSPLYPDFPADVQRRSGVELYLNALWHYVTLRRLPLDASPRPPLFHDKAPRVIEAGSAAELASIMTELAGAKRSLSPQDKDDLIKMMVHFGPDTLCLLPESISVKEIAAIVCAQLLAMYPDEAAVKAYVRRQMRAPTDVLRLAVAQCKGDVSLFEPTKFTGFSRAMRRFLLSLVEACEEVEEDMFRWPERWKRLGEALHPGEYARRFPVCHRAFANVRAGTRAESFNRKVEHWLAIGDTESASRLLRQRPGELARRLDHMLRLNGSEDAVCVAFDTVAAKVSTAVLLQMRAHFQHRQVPGLRVFLPKGDLVRAFATQDLRPEVPVEATKRIVKTTDRILLERFSKLPPLGTCYVAPELADYCAPMSQRGASTSLRTVTRGSRLPLPSSRFVRLFLWWKNGRSRTDIDLSAAMFDADFRYVDSLAYYNLAGWGGCHSGDIVDAPQGAAEFIDLDLQRLRVSQVRFVVASINSYSEQPFCELPECFAGWMSRLDANSGEIFDARTVEDRIDIASNSQICLPLVFDLLENRVIWLDLALKRSPGFNNTIQNLSGVSLMLRAFAHSRRPNLYDLFDLHVRARGHHAESRDTADLVFSVDGSVTPFDVDLIRASYL